MTLKTKKLNEAFKDFLNMSLKCEKKKDSRFMSMLFVTFVMFENGGILNI